MSANVLLGISVDIVKRRSRERQPRGRTGQPADAVRTFGDSLLSVHDLDILVPTDTPLIEFRPPKTDDVTRKMANTFVAR